MTEQTKQPAVKKPGEKKWLLWSLLGFTGILLITAVVLFLQIKKPASVPLPSPRPSASPELPSVQEATVNVCEYSFVVSELECTGITLSPTSTSVTASDDRDLTAQVTGGSGTYTHSWTINSSGSDPGDLYSTSGNPTTWTAPDSLSDSQTWTITDTVTDASSAVETDTCEVTVSFGGLTGCFETCSTDADCDGNLQCLTVSSTKRCVNSSCVEDADCSCASPSPSPSVSPTPTPSPSAPVTQASPSPDLRAEQPQLPEAGVSTPAVLGVSVGILLMLLGLLF